MNGRLLSMCAGLILAIPGQSALAVDMDPRIPLIFKAESVLKEGGTWPGFSLFKKPVLLYETGKRSWLISHPSPPTGAVPVSSTPYIIHRLEGPRDDLTSSFDFEFPVNGVGCYAYRFESSDSSLTDVSTFVHEGFHSFQDTSKWTRLDEKHVKYGFMNAENLALAELEQRALARALQTPDLKLAERWVKMFVAVRKYRDKMIGGDNQAVEDGQEQIEGMADYVENLTMNRPGLAGGGHRDIVRHAVARLKANLTQKDMDKKRYYFTGSSQGILLDRIGRAAWKASVAKGESLFSLVAKAFPVDEKESGGLLEAAKTELFGYQSQLDDIRESLAWQAEGRREALERFESSPGIRIHLESLPGSSYSTMSSTSEYFALNDGKTFYTGIGEYSRQAESFRFLLRDRPMLDENAADNFYISRESQAWLNDKACPWKKAERAFNKIKITDSGFELESGRAGIFKYDGKALTISWTNTEEGK